MGDAGLADRAVRPGDVFTVDAAGDEDGVAGLDAGVEVRRGDRLLRRREGGAVVLVVAVDGVDVPGLGGRHGLGDVGHGAVEHGPGEGDAAGRERAGARRGRRAVEGAGAGRPAAAAAATATAAAAASAAAASSSSDFAAATEPGREEGHQRDRQPDEGRRLKHGGIVSCRTRARKEPVAGLLGSAPASNLGRPRALLWCRRDLQGRRHRGDRARHHGAGARRDRVGHRRRRADRARRRRVALRHGDRQPRVAPGRSPSGCSRCATRSCRSRSSSRRTRRRSTA